MHFVRGHHGIFIPHYSDIGMPEAKVGVSGHITVELIDAKTKKIKRKLSFNNLITNAGLDALSGAGPQSSDGASLSRYCGVGTGSTAPANTDTTLVAEKEIRTNGTFSSSNISYVAGPPDYYKSFATYLFTESQVNGNLTEVGFFNATSAGTMFSRQLFKDDLGSPTAVTKTSSDQLRITYEVRIYPPAADVVSSAVDISGTAYDITARALRVSTTTWNGVFSSAGFSSIVSPTNILYYTGAMVARTSSSFTSGLVGFASSVVLDAYVSGNYFRTATHKLEPADGTGDIQTIGYNNSILIFGFGFSPALVKTNTKRLTISSKISWARHV